MPALTRRDFMTIAGLVGAGSMLRPVAARAQSSIGDTSIRFGKGAEDGIKESGVNTDRLADLNSLFEKQISDGIHPGAQLTVRVKDHTVFNRFGGFAITPSTPMQLDTKNLLFSSTKPVGAAATMLLAEQGYLELDKPLVYYWPAFARGDARKKDVTVRHVLGHQGGFPGGPSDFNYEHFNDPAEAMHAMERVELTFEPGTKFEYHPINYGWALGELIRRTSGMPVERFVQENVFAPLGCINASIGVPAEELDEISFMYRDNDRSHYIEIWNSPTVRMAPCVASSGHAPAEDLARFYAMIAKGGMTDSGQRLLKKETIDLMTTEAPVEKTGKPSGYGLGFFISRHDDEVAPEFNYGHGGSSSSFGRNEPALNLSVAFITNGHQDADIQSKRMADIWTACRALVI